MVGSPADGQLDLAPIRETQICETSYQGVHSVHDSPTIRPPCACGLAPNRGGATPSLVVELDAAITHCSINVSRSRVVALAIRQFLDQGGMEMFPTYPDWP